MALPKMTTTVEIHRDDLRALMIYLSALQMMDMDPELLVNAEHAKGALRAMDQLDDAERSFHEVHPE